MTVLDATIKAIAAAIMQSSFFISPRSYVPRFKISHRLFAARCVAVIIDRGRLLPRGYRPKPRLRFRCLWVAHNTANYCSARVTESHIVVVPVPMIRDTAFACRYKNKLCVNDLRMCHREHESPLVISDF
jgi:hypothetical protein